jgi:Fe-S oxidoreductase
VSTATLARLADVRADATHCTFCPKMCRFACPVAAATGRETHNPWGIDRAVVALADGRADTAVADAVFACTGCRRCGSACLPGLDLPTHVRAARAQLVAAGVAPHVAVPEARAPLGRLATEADAEADLVVWPDCAGSGAADDALAAVLAAAGRAWALPSEPVCCGARAADVGQAADAEARLAHGRDGVAGARRVVVADPHCARRLRVDAGDDRVTTVAELLAELVDALPLRATGERAVWHDPCWLARGLGVTAAPRQVIAAVTGRPPVEAWPHPDRTGCTGAGMGLPATHPAAARAMAEGCRRDLAAAGADVVVTGCADAGATLAAGELTDRQGDLVAFVANRLAP